MTSFPGAFTGRINRPSLPRSNTFNGPPFSNPSRRHHHSGKTVWRFEVKVIVMVIIFIVMIYYLKMRFVNGFALILAMQFCVAATPQRGKFLSDSSMDMKQKSQNHATARQAARLEELKHSVSTAGTHKNLADARIVFVRRRLRNRFFFRWLPSALVGGNSKRHFAPLGQLCRFASA